MRELKVEYCDEETINGKIRKLFEKSEEPFKLMMAFFNSTKEQVRGMVGVDNGSSGNSDSTNSGISSFLHIEKIETFIMLPKKFLDPKNLEEMLSKALKGKGKENLEKDEHSVEGK